MNKESQSGVELLNYEPTRNRFRAEVLSGLRKSPKELPSKYLYDEQGSLWFDRITALEEYYPTRTEAAIMESCMDEMMDLIGTYPAGSLR